MGELVSALLGGLVALGGWNIQEIIQARKRTRHLKAAIACEVGILVELIRQQHYRDELRSHAASLRASSNEFGYPVFVIPIRQSYFTVFEANASILGELETHQAVEIVAFYQQARSLVDSLSSEGNLDNTITPALEAAERYDQLANAIDRLCSLGDGLSARLATTQVADQIRRVAKQLLP